MQDITIVAKDACGISDTAIAAALRQSLEDWPGLKKVLLVPPDLTRMHSGAGEITAIYYDLLKDSYQVDILPALGTHEPMTEQEVRTFFGSKIPLSCFLTHNWRADVVTIGEVPGEFMEKVSDGLACEPVNIEINKHLLDRSYDLIISIGQVVPHEVAGMANYSKNILVGCGGMDIINKSHMLGAIFGMEKVMGKDHSPVRQVFDYAETHFIFDLPLLYVLTVTTQGEGGVILHGLFIGRNRKLFEAAVKLSQEKNLIYLDRPLQKVVVYLDEREFKSTWLGNKAIYRTRMAIADGGELIILAPGVRKFGEDGCNDLLIRKYGYVGRNNILKLCQDNDDLKCSASVAAHLIHGSSDDRFSITYAVGKMTRVEVERAGFQYMDFTDACRIYDPRTLKDGINLLADGQEIFYISNPALGLWAYTGEQPSLTRKKP
jgi:nickel-dependent lactate racemase